MTAQPKEPQLGEDVYDKVAWHFPGGSGCLSLESGKRHLEVLMDWLAKEELLSNEGREAMMAGVDADFSLTSGMLTDDGNELLRRFYDDWLRGLEYGKRPSLARLQSGFAELSGRP